MSTITFLGIVSDATRQTPVFWSYTGNQQTAYEVKVFTQAQYEDGGFDPDTSAVTWTSGVIVSGSTISVVGPGFLHNGSQYRAYLRIREGASTWSGWSHVTYLVAIPISGLDDIVPSTGVVTRTRPDSNATPEDGLQVDNIQVRRVFQYARNTGYTTNLITITEANYSVIPSGVVPFNPLPDRLNDGTWYMRCRLEDSDGQVGAWSPNQTLTVSAAAVPANHSPNGTDVLYNGNVSLAWDFSSTDPDDYQTAYEVEVWQTSDQGGTTISTGEVVVPPQEGFGYEVTIPVTAGYKDVSLAWRVRVKGLDDIWSVWATDAFAFTARDAPVVAITSPADGGDTNDPTPTFTWTFTAAGRTQSQYRVTVTNVSTLETVISSGWLSGTNLSWTPSYQAVQAGSSYQVTVEVIDSVGLRGQDTHSFDPDYTAPTAVSAPTVDGSSFESAGTVIVTWTGATEDSNFVEWRVLRRLEGATAWKRIATVAQGTNTYTDYACPANTDVEYAVVQVAVDPTFGTTVESVPDPTDFSSGASGYAIIVPDNSALNLFLSNVTSDSLEEEVEETIHRVIGRGRVDEKGTNYGVDGTLTAQIYSDDSLTARQKKLKLDTFRKSGLSGYLRNPFGDVWLITLTQAKYDRVAGVGTDEYVTVAIQYSEIEDDT